MKNKIRLTNFKKSLMKVKKLRQTVVKVTVQTVEKVNMFRTAEHGVSGPIQPMISTTNW